MIELLKGFPRNVVAIACHGEVSRKDYDEVLIPAVEKALQSNDKVRMLYEVAPDFEGYEAGAAWEDFKTGVAHFTKWDRIAVITDIEWIGAAVKIFGLFLPSTVRVYAQDDAAKARLWITQAV
ncbi:MAG: STAS/SEC14 domain-containing protein [Pseudomonadota bacterium]